MRCTYCISLDHPPNKTLELRSRHPRRIQSRMHPTRDCHFPGTEYKINSLILMFPDKLRFYRTDHVSTIMFWRKANVEWTESLRFEKIIVAIRKQSIRNVSTVFSAYNFRRGYADDRSRTVMDCGSHGAYGTRVIAVLQRNWKLWKL